MQLHFYVPKENETLTIINYENQNVTICGLAAGMDDTLGVLVVDVTDDSNASKFLQANDVILSFNGKQTNRLRDLFEARMSVIGSNAEIVIFRNQKEIKKHVELANSE